MELATQTAPAPLEKISTPFFALAENKGPEAHISRITEEYHQHLQNILAIIEMAKNQPSQIEQLIAESKSYYMEHLSKRSEPELEEEVRALIEKSIELDQKIDKLEKAEKTPKAPQLKLSDIQTQQTQVIEAREFSVNLSPEILSIIQDTLSNANLQTALEEFELLDLQGYFREQLQLIADQKYEAYSIQHTRYIDSTPEEKEALRPNIEKLSEEWNTLQKSIINQEFPNNL